jgi:hypothetical protein
MPAAAGQGQALRPYGPPLIDTHQHIGRHLSGARGRAVEAHASSVAVPVSVRHHQPQEEPVITVQDRATAITRAKQAIAYLEAHPRTTKSNLGAARDQANLVQNCSSTHDVYDAVHGLEALVVEIYGHIPTHKPGQPDHADQPASAVAGDVSTIQAGE